MSRSTAPSTRSTRLIVAAAALGCLGLAVASTSADAARGPAGSAHTSPAKGGVMSGIVVDSGGSHHALKGIVVKAKEIDSGAFVGSDTTDASGAWEIDGLTSDEYGVKINGARKGYEVGWLGCAHGVVPTFGEACTFSAMDLGRARLDRD